MRLHCERLTSSCWQFDKPQQERNLLRLKSLACRATYGLDWFYNDTGVQKPRGAKRKYDGKVELSDLSRLAGVLREKLNKLKMLAPNFKLTFTYPDAYRTSNTVGYEIC